MSLTVRSGIFRIGMGLIAGKSVRVKVRAKREQGHTDLRASTVLSFQLFVFLGFPNITEV